MTSDLEYELFQEYFQLDHNVSINLQAHGDLSELPSFDTFEQMIPTPFKMASEMSGIEQTMLRPLRQLGDVVEPLADYLKAQSKKIDLLMSYILQGLDDDDQKFVTKSYGGGGLIFETEQDLAVDQYYVCKLFFTEDATAIFCLTKIIAKEKVENSYIYTMLFSRIREEDREVVVRASLHQQQKQLLKKTLKQD